MQEKCFRGLFFVGRFSERKEQSIAKFIKNNFSGIDVRASVNMSIGTVQGMKYMSEYFDSFYLQRELNRNISEIERLKKYCDENGKKLYASANSGCVNFCSAHVFYDNLVSHENEISQMDNGYSFKGICREFFKKDENKKRILEALNFIRPEDTYIYEDLIPFFKLATRVSKNAVTIIHAYTS